MRLSFLLAASSCAALACAAPAQTVPAALQASSAAQKPLTVQAVNEGRGGVPPQGAVWSPDGGAVSFVAYGGVDGLPAAKDGDIVAVDAATGKKHVLVSSTQIEGLAANEINEKDRDHRERYHMASYLWTADAKHLLLDRAGELWLWNLAKAKGTLVVNTKTESGDDPKFSPDGKTVSYLRGHNLYVHPVGAGDEVALTSSPSGTVPGALLNGEVDWVYLEELDVRTNYAWAPDSKAIAYLQMDEAKVPQYPIEDYIPTHATVDYQRYPQAGDPNPAVRVGVVPVSGGATTWIDVPLSAGNDYVPRFGWVNEHTLWVEVLKRDQKAMNIYLADAQTGASKLMYTETDPKYLEENYDVTFLPHGHFLNTSWGDGHTHLYLYAFDEAHPLSAQAKLERQLTHGDYEVEQYEVPGAEGSADAVYFTSTEGSPLETHLWSMKLDGTGKRELTPGKGSHNTLVSPDGRFYTDETSQLLTPPVVRLCATAESGSCNPLWQSTPVPEAEGTRTRLVTLKAADGKTTLYGRLTVPTVASGSHSVPIILNPYGGPLPTAGVKDSWSGMLALSQLLAQHGYAVLEVDNRGSGGRGRAFQQADFRDFGEVQLADQLAALDQTLAADDRLDAKRVGWWGWSWGGFFTLYAMTHTDRIKAGFAVAPGNTDLRNYDSVYSERYMGLPSKNADAYKRSDVNDVAGKLKGRVLIAQGTGDDNVHMGNMIQFVQAMITAGVPYDLQLFPRLTHSLNTFAARNELFTRLLYHFDTYLKPLPQ